MLEVKIQKGPRGFCDSEGERIYYETHGEGEALVFSHGMGGNHAIWYQQVPVFAQSYRVVTWDHRGFARSSDDAGKSGPTAAVNDLRAILDQLGIDRAHLVGQSMGGWTVLGFAVRYPERVITLTLADTIGGIFNPRIEQAYDDMIVNRNALAPPDDMPMGSHPALGEQLAGQNPARAFLYEQLGSVAEPPPTAVRALLRSTSYSHEDLKKLAMPIQFIVGSNDPLFPPDVIREAATILPPERIIEIPDTGHSPYFESPDKWNDALAQFLKSSGSA